MIEPPQFRTVLRGADPEQVAEAIKELHTSLVVARRAAADRTIELSRMQEEHQTLRSELEAAQQRIAELEQSRSGSGTGYGDVGSRISSILRLAEEEAEQLRATAEAEIAERRERASRELGAELTAEQARLDELRRRAAQLSDELTEASSQADAEIERLRALALEEANRIRQQAREDGARVVREAEQQRAEALAHRDRVHAHLREVAQLIDTVVDSDDTAEVPDEEVEPQQPASADETEVTQVMTPVPADAAGVTSASGRDEAQRAAVR
jgi:chromosome segregation ATPase